MSPVFSKLDVSTACRRCYGACRRSAGSCRSCKIGALLRGLYVCRACPFEGTYGQANDHRAAVGHIIDSPSHIPTDGDYATDGVDLLRVSNASPACFD